MYGFPIWASSNVLWVRRRSRITTISIFQRSNCRTTSCVHERQMPEGSQIMAMDERLLKVGVLGCGPIAQAAHFESAVKARNAELYAICDVAEDLLERMAWTFAPTKTFRDYDEMLADPALDAVIIATSDAFHVVAAIAALR